MRKVKKEPRTGAGPHVTRHPMLRRAPLVEVGPDNPVWRGEGTRLASPPPPGTILRLLPPASPDLDPGEYADAMRAAGCAVRVAPAEVADAVVARQARAAVPARSHRQVVLDLVAAADAVDRGPLQELVGAVLDRVGL